MTSKEDLFKRIREEVIENQYATLNFPIGREQIETTVSYFFEFLKLPDEVKSQLYFKFDPLDRGSHVGYMRRKQLEGNLDEKEYFHFNPHVEKFSNMGKHIPDCTKDFFESAQDIYQAGNATLELLMQAFETEFPGISKRMMPEKGCPRSTLRFLKYSNLGKGEFLAKGHCDIGDITFAIAESSPGLRIGKDQDSLKPAEHVEGSVLFMPAKKLHTHTSKDFHPAWHDVVQNGQDTISEDVARWAVVYFADRLEGYRLTHEETHTPGY